MKRLVSACLAILLTAGSCLAADAGIRFCEGIDEQWNPIGEGGRFAAPQVSWILTSEKPFGVPALMVSVYRKKGSEETVAFRKTLDINPEWNMAGMRNMALPGAGDYSLAVTLPDGRAVASAPVSAGDGKAPEKKEETVGALLKQLYERYAPKQ